MPKVPITFACGLYDRMLALYTGEVQADGIDLNFLAIDNPRQIFDRMGRSLDFDACEMSSSEVFSRHAAGRREMVALPVFPSRVFRHGFITVNRKAVKTPKDLEGKRIGVPLYTQTAAVFIRGLLQRRIRRRSLGRALGAGRHQQRAVAWQPGGALAAQARVDRAEQVGPLAQRAARGERDPGDPRQRSAGCAAHQSGRAAVISEFPRRRARVRSSVRASSRSCISSPCVATSTSGIRSLPRASMRR